jgi:hypothetical protein
MLIRTDLYPIADKESARRAEVIARAKADLDSRQVCSLDDFITEAARQRMIEDVKSVLPKAYPNKSHRTCFLNQKPDANLPADHPKNTFFDASYNMMAYDLFDPESALPAFYRWEPLRQFIAEILGEEKLYLNADPYQPANVLCYKEGDRSTWHFDRGNEFTVTLMLQESKAGGVFEIAPEIIERQDDDSIDMSALAGVLKGDKTNVFAVPRAAGSLVIFRGDRSVHRVSPVEGDRDRLMAVLVYEKEPGVMGRPEVNATIYGPRVVQGAA